MQTNENQNQEKKQFFAKKQIKKYIYRSSNGLLKYVKASGFDGDANGLLVFFVLETALKHSIDDVLESRVDRFDLGRIGGLKVLHLQFGVVVDALGNYCLHIFG